MSNYIIKTDKEKVNDWYKKHTKCPDCNNVSNRSIVGIQWNGKTEFKDDFSIAHCLYCRWKGKVKDLK